MKGDVGAAGIAGDTRTIDEVGHMHFESSCDETRGQGSKRTLGTTAGETSDQCQNAHL